MRIVPALWLLPVLLAAAEPRPDWLSGSSAEHPKAAFVTGVGEAQGQEKAADRARTEIAKFFGVELFARTATSARESGAGFTQQVSDDVRTFTARMLEGVDIAKYWRDEQGNHYALAVLDRSAALANLTTKLSEYDAEFKETSEQLEKTEGKFARLRLALQLVKAARGRKEVHKQYRVLAGKSLPGPSSQEALSKARAAIKAVTVQIHADGENAEAVGSRIIDELSAYGLRAREEGSRAADIMVEAKAQAEALPPENLLWFWSKGAITVRMSYGSSGEVFTRFEELAQEASRDPGTSVDSTLLALASKASRRIFHVITSQDLSDD